MSNNRSGTTYSAPTDANRRPVLLGASDIDGATPLPVEIHQANGGVNVNIVGTSSSNSPTAVLNGETTVTTAGTRVVLASSTSCKSVTVKALPTNTGYIYVGNSTVDSTNGLILQAADSISLDIANLSSVYIDSQYNGEGVTYLGVN